jgi:cell division septation protein DedD
MHWPEVTLDQYEAVRKDVSWETRVPAGAKFHVAWVGADGFRVIDLWESAQDFEHFLQNRLAPSVAKHGLVGQPNVVMAPAHAIFAPNVPRPAKPAAKRAAGARAKAKKAAARPKKKARAAKRKAGRGKR